MNLLFYNPKSLCYKLLPNNLEIFCAKIVMLSLKSTARGVDTLTAFKNLAGILYNDTSDCFDIYAQFIECADPTSCGLGNDAKAWDYQACIHLVRT